MEMLSLIVGLVVIAVVIAGIVILARRLKTINQSEDTRAFDLLAKQMEGLSQRIDTSSQSVQSAVQAQLGQSVKIVQDVTERLTRLDETNRQVMGFADQLQRLQNTLNNPKQRGVLGEYYLQTLLAQSFQPNQYKLQYKFKDGSIVDAVLHFGDKLIPIDSKFSLENYNRIVDEQDATERQRLEEVFRRDLKERIDETAKYVRPEEGTLEFAFMFIPAEGIYYDLLVNKVGAIKVNTRALLEYAIHEKKVHIVSPTTFYVTLQSLMVGMNAFKIQEGTEQIMQNVGLLGKHIRAYEDYFKKLGGHLGTTVNAYNLASKELAKIDKDVVKIGGGETSIEVDRLNKPASDE